MLTADFFFVFLYALAEAYSDYSTIKKELPIDHNKGGLERAAAMIGFAFMAEWRSLQGATFFTTDQLLVLLSVGVIFCCQILFFWVSFDLLLNTLRDKPITYIGQDKRTAWLDKQAAKFIKMEQGAGLVFLIIKLIALSIAVTAYTLLQ